MCVCVGVHSTVDDQLDEDDLELIKENTGFDIQVVSVPAVVNAYCTFYVSALSFSLSLSH